MKEDFIHLFITVEDILKELGYDVYNPSNVSWGTTKFKNLPAEGMRLGITHLVKSESIFLVGDWRNARGCIAEAFIASLTGITIYELDLEILQKYKKISVVQVDISRYNASEKISRLLSQQDSLYDPASGV